MNIILLEDSRFPVGSFIAKVRQKFPRSSTLYINNKNFFDNLETLREKPLLTKCYCVITNEKLSEAQFKEIFKMDNLNIVHLSNKNKLQDVKDVLSNLNVKYNIVNNLKPPKEVVRQYVIEQLGVSDADAKYICNRHKYHIPTIVNSVAVLSTFSVINRKTIKEYTVRFGNVSFYSLLDVLLGLDTKVSVQSAIKLIYSYRYGFGYILDFLKNELEKFLCIYDYMSRGLISLANYMDFTPDIEDKVFRKIGEYQLKKIIEAYSILSYEKLYFIYLQVCKIKPSQSNIYKLVTLIGG